MILNAWKARGPKLNIWSKKTHTVYAERFQHLASWLLASQWEPGTSRDKDGQRWTKCQSSAAYENKRLQISSNGVNSIRSRMKSLDMSRIQLQDLT